MAINVRHNRLLIAIFLAVSLFAPLQVGAPSVALAGTVCPSRLAVGDSMTNLTLPPGVSAIKDSLGGVKQVNQGFGKAPGGFAYTYNGTYYDPFHRGIDFNDVYQRLYAPWPGKVNNYVGGGWGTGDGGPNMVVELVLSNGYRVYLLHLSEFGASGSVTAGTYLGTTGNTGYSSGPHLHMEMDYPDGAIVPPEWWACKSGAPAGEGGVTDGEAVTSKDVIDDFATDGALPVPPWVLFGFGTLANQASGQLKVKGSCCGYNGATRDVGSSDGSISYKLISQTNPGGLLVRYVSSDYYLYVGSDSSGNFGLFKIASGTLTKLVASTKSSGAVYRVEMVGSSLKLYMNGTLQGSATDEPPVGATKFGFYTRNGSESIFDDFKYTEKPDGSTTATTEGGTTAPTTDGKADTSGWNPMAWLWDKVKGLLVPSPDDWKEIAADLDKLTDKEPVGTLKDVGAFAGSIKSAATTAPAVGYMPQASGRPCSGEGFAGLFCWVSLGSVWQGAVTMSGSIATAVDTVSIGGMNGTTFIKVGIDVLAAFGVWEYLNSRTVLAA